MDETWRTATKSADKGACVEARLDGPIIQVRDTKDREGPVLSFTAAEWDAFLDGAKNGEFDL